MGELKQLQAELNRKDALKGVPNIVLAEILPLYAKVRLNEWASLFQVAGRSKMNKQQLVDALVEEMTDTDFLSELFVGLNNGEKASLKRLAKLGMIVKDNDGTFADLDVLKRKGLIHYFSYKESLYIVLPQEINIAWKFFDQESSPINEQASTIIERYISAFANLYGAYKVEQLVEVYNKQQTNQVTVPEVQYVLEQSLEDASEYGCIGDYVVHNYFIMHQENANALGSNTMQLADMLMRRSSKAWYIPEAAELLRYSDDFYYEITPQLSALYEYLHTYLVDNEVQLENIMDQIQYYCKIEQPMNEIMSVFVDYDVIFETHEQAKLVVALVNEVYNHTRIWSNAGYTPHEMYSQYEQPLDRPSMATPQARKQKIGRNEPCPCNSGKKYKKCCGA